MVSQETQQVENDSVLNIEKLSIYFKEKIPENLLKNITYPNRRNEIRISFYVNKENIPFKTYTNSNRNRALNEALVSAFENYPIQQLNYNFQTKKKYSFSIIKREFGKNIIKIDSIFKEEVLPECTSCKNLDFYIDIEKCITEKIRYYYYNNINFSLANSLDSKNDKISLKMKFFIDSLGFLNLKSINAPDVFKENIQQITKNFPETFTPFTINNRPKIYNYNFSLTFNKGDSPKPKEANIYFDSIFKPTTTNEFALYLKEKLPAEDIENANLNKINDRLSIYFELDSNGKPKEITTTSRSKSLENKVITLFKNFDFNKLVFVDKHPFNRYFTSIIIHENGQNLIKTNSIIGYSRNAMFKGCEKSKNTKEAKRCFSQKVQKHFISKFNTRIVNTLGLSPGPKKVYIFFKVNKKGKIVDISCRAPHQKIKDEVIKVMKKLPKVKPAVFGREKVTFRLNIPFTLIVE